MELIHRTGDYADFEVLGEMYRLRFFDGLVTDSAGTEFDVSYLKELVSSLEEDVLWGNQPEEVLYR